MLALVPAVTITKIYAPCTMYGLKLVGVTPSTNGKLTQLEADAGLYLHAL